MREVVGLSPVGKRPFARWKSRRTLPMHSAVSAAILILTGCFHLYRGVPIEAVVFCVAGFAVLADANGWLPKPPVWGPPLPGPAISVLLAGFGAVVISLLQVKGTVETVVLVAIGVTVMAVCWCQPDTPNSAIRSKLRPAAWSWTVVGLCLCLSELLVFLLADPPLREEEYPTLTYLLQPIVDQTVGRAALLAVWLIAGLALLRWSPTDRHMKSTVLR